MPLCTLVVPKNWSVSMIEDAENRLREIVLVNLIDDFGIPDPNDQEMRIVRTDDESAQSPELQISFTVGDVYPGHETFEPSDELKEKVGIKVQELAKRELGVSETSIEAWEDSSFLICKNPDNPQKVNYRPERNIMDQIDRPVVRIVLQPEKAEAAHVSAPRREGEPIREGETYRGLAREIADGVSETLGIPEETGCRTEILVAEVADCGVSVEIDFGLKEGHGVPTEAHLAIAQRAVEILNENSLTRNEEVVEVWARPGLPQVQRFN